MPARRSGVAPRPTAGAVARPDAPAAARPAPGAASPSPGTEPSVGRTARPSATRPPAQVPVSRAANEVVSGELASQRGYAKEDLDAIAEIGLHYLRSGGYREAETIFEGLTAVSPSESRYHLGLGLARDHNGNVSGARQAYEAAESVDPEDDYAAVNLAELDLADGNRHGALSRLSEVLKRNRAPARLLRKAQALLSILA